MDSRSTLTYPSHGCKSSPLSRSCVSRIPLLSRADTSEQLQISYRIMQGTWPIISLTSKPSAAQAIARVVFGLKGNLLRQSMLASKRNCQKPNSPYYWRSYDNSATYLGQVCFVPLTAIPTRPLRPKP
ncbi:hypothetical protein BDP81DRAFT_61677 [Colletotrichum phormii]|uniref:Uncharacterized protein n=1 Tax=Colletotrichum phormii TaxID=359342 RepID=A0AAJ0EBN7_9PEZI|nr:uncharacterized protein BDP81DRAFT_61677 [Colletotrichum phormii]KAK1633832.1 hypothetical protein BDP81DRAFT_61677 [Colletotrichum phormii]